MSVAATLAERGSRYGQFADHARIAQGVQDVLRAAPKWDELDLDMKQALTVIADKMARILNGDPFYLDNWHDIQGYAKLIEDRLNMIETQPEPLSLFNPNISPVPNGGVVVNTGRNYVIGEAPCQVQAPVKNDGYSRNADGAVIGGAAGGGYYD